MKTQKSFFRRIAFLLFIAIFMGMSGSLQAQGPGGGEGPGHFRMGRLLTEEQRAELWELVNSLMDQGATREEIRDVVFEKLTSWGIEIPEDWDGFNGPGFGPFGHFGNLSDEQREAIREKVREMREQGASREEIREAVRDMLEEFGVEPGGVFSQLTDEQRTAIHEKIQQMREQGASREEIHQAITDMLEAWGIELPEGWDDWGGFRRFGGGPFGFMHLLTEEQRIALRERIQELRDQGAGRQEIRQAIDEILDEWGIERPHRHGRKEDGPDRMGRNRGRGKGSIGAHSSPNPFNPETTLYYSLESPAYVSLCIYNVQGQLVRVLVDEEKHRGNYSVRWDGRYDNGEMAAAGIYVYRLDAGHQSLSGRVTLMK